LYHYSINSLCKLFLGFSMLWNMTIQIRKVFNFISKCYYILFIEFLMTTLLSQLVFKFVSHKTITLSQSQQRYTNISNQAPCSSGQLSQETEKEKWGKFKEENSYINFSYVFLESLRKIQKPSERIADSDWDSKQMLYKWKPKVYSWSSACEVIWALSFYIIVHTLWQLFHLMTAIIIIIIIQFNSLI
jgi:hypothetical protein